ncbi:MAG: type II secretion system protein GspE, partial [Firmicutes bacterium]|nr:type II secretion system protein GspE [Bacillota bacterium]
GRTAIHEVMPVDGTLRKLIHEARGMEELRHHVISQGMQSLLEDGLNRVERGLTTLQEIMRVAYTVT